MSCGAMQKGQKTVNNTCVTGHLTVLHTCPVWGLLAAHKSRGGYDKLWFVLLIITSACCVRTAVAVAGMLC